MRSPKYMSPSSLKTFETSQEEYYLRYLADDRPPRLPQTMPMSIGSAFDAYVKNYLVKTLFGSKMDPKYELDTIFEAQVESHNRTWARDNGAYVFACYKKSGALADLMLDLDKAIGPPRFEFSIQGAIGGEREGTFRKIGIPLLGKPDVFFINSEGAHCLFDWKVNGYCAKRPVSPAKGYVMLRDGWTIGRPSRNANQPHKDATLLEVNGIKINTALYLEDVDRSWADQLAIYAWLLGEDIGHETIVGIDQVACDNSKGEEFPFLRFAEHRCRVSERWQINLFDRLATAWGIINSDHFFRDTSLEESKSRCKLLDNQAEALRGDGTEEDDWFNTVTRSH